MTQLDIRLKHLIESLSANEHIDKDKKQKVWDSYLLMLRYTNLFDANQQMAMNKAKRLLLNNKRWT